jgi:prolyl-tRNA editing enzyme YbaK/EbsC (Cys-tRNA(Pro) deacylase)
MTPNIPSLVISFLDNLNFPYELIDCKPEFADTQKFCATYGFNIENCGNTIIVASKKMPKKYSACIVKGSDKLNVNQKVRKLMEVSKASFASGEEALELTGMMIGGITPFALPNNIPIYIDEKISNLEYVIFGSGDRSSKIKISPEIFSKISNAEFIDDLSIN